MLSWLARHRPGRRKAKKQPSKTVEVPLVGISTAVPPRPPAFRPRHRSTDRTLVDGDDFHSDSDASLFFEPDLKVPLRRCASPDSFDSLPVRKDQGAKTAAGTVKKETPTHRLGGANPDDPSLWKKSQLLDNGCFGPVSLDYESPVEVPKSKRSKLASGTAHFGAILESSVILGEATNIPYLKGVAGIILVISKSVHATEDNEVNCTRLIKMVNQLASIASRHFEQDGNTPQFLLGVQSLYQAFTRIQQALQESRERSYARRLIESSRDADLLQECEKELQHCLDTFQIRSHIATSVAIKRKDTADQAFEVQVSNMLQTLGAQAVSEIEDMSEVPEPSDEPDDLPPMPQIFYGRENELSELVNLFCQPSHAHAVLLGQGGIGKSSLALALLHRPEIKRQFHHRRLFIKCNSATGAFHLLSRLGSALGLPDVAADAKSYKETVFTSLRCSPVQCLIVFDELDDAWESPSTKREVEDLLTDLSNIPKVSLLLTLRGTQRPMGPAYSKPYPAPLGPLSPEASRQTFFAISDVPEDDADAPLVDVLAHMVGFLPLAITLLAQLAQYEPLPFLTERYREEGTAMLCGDGDDGMEACIERTLYSARVSECPAALEVLGVLARFPEGTAKTEVSALVVSEGRLPAAMVNKCLSVLYTTALVSVVPKNLDAPDPARQQERLMVPPVVRTYLQRHILDGGRYRSLEDS
ncbi:P-loop containing nucleoside triphosphate hydrolase protein [Mycena sanguinolenta]|nr:P-loop containing nucleoside triphosphate hydrolase protein [Mycena sanguinolenta]